MISLFDSLFCWPDMSVIYAAYQVTPVIFTK